MAQNGGPKPGIVSTVKQTVQDAAERAYDVFTGQDTLTPSQKRASGLDSSGNPTSGPLKGTSRYKTGGSGMNYFREDDGK